MSPYSNASAKAAGIDCNKVRTTRLSVVEAW
jgi:hypothetical protein